MKLKHVSWLPAAIMMVIIFYFSSKPAVSSEESSMLIANKLLTVYENIVNENYQDDIKIEKLETINHIVRKSAHFTEYAILACTIAFHLWIRKKDRRLPRLFLIAVLLTALYAATDEYHQTFIMGRSGELKDVLIDTSGAAAGVILFCFSLFIIRNKRKRS